MPWQIIDPEEQESKWTIVDDKDTPTLTDVYTDIVGERIVEDDAIASQPEVMESPEPFDTTLNQMVGMPEGTDIQGATPPSKPPQMQEPVGGSLMERELRADVRGEKALKGLGVLEGKSVVSYQIECIFKAGL